MLAKASAIPRVDVASSRGSADWRQHAVCRNFDYKGTGEEPWHPVSVADEERSKGMKICRERCPVRETCLDWALSHESPSYVHGVMGGKTAEERRSILRRQQRDRAKAKAAEAVAEEKAA